jgi:diguanylate cyclase (GGDEF)-like protein/putative nucleotidyltransferase with HDIG domain/PAS domain S-box-containing protein
LELKIKERKKTKTQPINELLESRRQIGELEASVVEHKRARRVVQEALEYIDNIVATVREPLLVLGADLKVVSANRSFYRTFKVTPEETEGKFLYNLGNRQWDIPKLRELLERILPEKTTFNDFKVEHDFETIGRRIMYLNARRIYREFNQTELILLAIEDVTERVRAEEAREKYSKRLEEMVQELRSQALADELTGLYNRRGFIFLAQQQLKLANRTKMGMLLLFADFNNLKWINDTLGHHKGDLALIETANILKETFREPDIIARIGGDEFVVLATEVRKDRDSAEILISRLQENLDTHNARGRRSYKLSLSMGITRYDTESPCSIDELLARADSLMYEEKRQVLASVRDAAGTQHPAGEKRQADEELPSFEQLQGSLGGTIKALTSAVAMKDPYTAGNLPKVAKLACAIAKEIGLPEEKIEAIRTAGLFHEIGKINIPAEVLSKPSRLSRAEMDLVKNHPQVSYDILKAIELPWPVAQIVFQHHERMDGSGYPQGLSGREILMEARILGVADVVGSMTSHRSYRSAHGIEKALEEISQNRGVLYDPEVVDACSEVITKKGFKFG